MAKYKFYLYKQNNAHGLWYANENVDKFVVIQAASYKQANRLADKQGIFNLRGCYCCGSRFAPLTAGDYDIRETEDYTKKLYDPAVVYLRSGEVIYFRRTQESSNTMLDRNWVAGR